MMDDSWICDFDILQFYLAIREEFVRRYLVPSRRLFGVLGRRYCHLLEMVWYIYDWDTGSSILI